MLLARLNLATAVWRVLEQDTAVCWSKIQLCECWSKTQRRWGGFGRRRRRARRGLGGRLTKANEGSCILRILAQSVAGNRSRLNLIGEERKDCFDCCYNIRSRVGNWYSDIPQPNTTVFGVLYGHIPTAVGSSELQ